MERIFKLLLMPNDATKGFVAYTDTENNWEVEGQGENNELLAQTVQLTVDKNIAFNGKPGYMDTRFYYVNAILSEWPESKVLEGPQMESKPGVVY